MFLIDRKKWPRIESLMADDAVLPIDFAITCMILKGLPQLSENGAAFVCKLIMASRLGHLCITKEGDQLIPLSSSLFENTACAQTLDQMAIKGMAEIAQLLPGSGQAVDGGFSPIIRLDSYFYLQKNAFFEERFIEEIFRIASHPIEYEIDNLSVSPLLNIAQKQAVYNSLSSTFSIITGGPGTGKTFTAAEIVRQYKIHGKKDLRIILAAPTGKASMHLESSVRKLIAADCSIESGTLHFLLSIKSSEGMMKKAPTLHADLVIVDEASMIDARMFFYFLSALQQGTAVILMGDKDQLPPIDSGSLFADLIEYAAMNKGISYSELTECMRSDRKQILDFAKAINQQDLTLVQKMLLDHTASLERMSFFDPSQSIKQGYEALWNFCQPRFSFIQDDLDPLYLLKTFDRFRILSCIRKGPLGVDAINQFFFNRFSSIGFSDWIAYPILIKKTQYSIGLFNGDTGVLIKYKDNDSEKALAYFYDKQGDLPRQIPLAMLPDYEYAYCLSIHKSQGSEYDDVLILAQQGSSLFGKEVLYTAVTRAKNSVFIDIRDDVLQQLINRSSRKISGLHARLRIAKEAVCYQES